MPRNWLQKVCDQLAPESPKKIKSERRPRGRIPMRVEPLEVRSLLAAPVIPGGQIVNNSLGENIGVNEALPGGSVYEDEATGINANNTVNGTVVGTVSASDADGDALTFAIPGFNAQSPFAINAATGQLTVNNFAAINFENTPSFTVTVTARDAGAATPTTTTATVTVNLSNRNDIPFIPYDQRFTVPENSVNGTPLTGNGGVVSAFTAINQDPNNSNPNLDPNNPNTSRGIANVSGQLDSGVNSAGDGNINNTLRYEILRASTSTVTQGGAGNEVQRITKPTALRSGRFVLSYNSTLPVTETTKGTAAVDEVQTLTIGAGAASKFFTLTFNGQTTRRLQYNAPAVTNPNADPNDPLTYRLSIQSELERLSTIGAGNVTVTGGDGGPYVITFIGQLSKTDVNSLSVTAYTQALSYGATAGTIEAALNALPTIGAGNVTVAGFSAPAAPSTDGWEVTFGGALANTNADQIGIINQADSFTISSDVPTLGRLTVSYGSDASIIGSRGDGQTGLITGVEFLNNFFGTQDITLLIRTQDLSIQNLQGTNVRNPFSQTLSYDEYVTVRVTDQSESAPKVTDKTFFVPENSPSSNTTPNGTVIGKVDEPAVSGDVTSLENILSPGTIKAFNYSIVPGLAGGNTNGAFAINPTTSEITVANASALDWETKPTYRLLIQVTDSGNPNLSTIAAMDINLSDVNEPTSIPDNQAFDVAEGAPVGTQLGAVRATDPDKVPPRVFTYEITNGNLNNTFQINPTTGVITVANNTLLDADTQPSFTLGIRIIDRDLQLSSDVNTVQINVVPVNTVPPVINDATFAINESPAISANFFVGNVTATTSGPSQTITNYAIVTSGTPFAINSNGDITVTNPALVNFEAQTVWQFVVQATDNTTPNALFNTAVVTVFVNDVNEQIVLPAATRTVAENAIAGTNVGAALTATDPDDGDGVPQGKIYSIISGNPGNVFAINASSGQITVANPGSLNFESKSTYDLIVQVKDTGVPFSATLANVTVNVTNANDTPVINDQTLPSVVEHRLPGTIVGTVVATDQDVGQTLTYSILGGNPGGAFTINSVTGEVSIANPGAVDFVQNPQFNLIVQVSDNQGSSSVVGGLFDTGIVTINVLDANAPIINDQTFLLAENSVAGTLVGNLGLAGGTAPFTYQITSGNTGNTFAVDAAGNITVANTSLVNFETNPTFTLQVTVVDNSNPQLTDNATITINLTEVNEQPTVNSPTFVLAENSAVGTVVGSVVGADVDAGQMLTYAITAGNASGAFAINAATGEITVLNPAALNFETNPQFVLTVTATDNGTPVLVSANGFVTINLTDVGENPVVPAATVTLPENSSVGTLVHTVVATDQDAGATLTYSIVSGNRNNTFAINATTGEITVANSAGLDFENEPPYNLVVRATDNTARTGQATITVKLTDVNDAPLVYNASVTIAENPALGALVLDYKVVASDRDQPAQTLTYAIVAGNTAGAFAIDASTGLITVVNPAAVDAETNPSFDLTIQVTDNGTPVRSSTANLRVNVGNVNDPPVIGNKTVTLVENSAVGTVVTNAGATDPEAQALSYAITGGNRGGTFAINATTGVITVANSAGLDWENEPPYDLQVTVTDSGSPNLSAVATIRVVLTNANDAPLLYNASVTIPENRAAGSLVLDYKIVARDQDAGQTLTYAIIGGNTSNAFVIDASTGLITVSNAAALDFEVNPQFNLTIRVTDNGTPSLSSTANLVVNLTNLNDAPTVPPQSFSLLEHSTVGTVVGTVTSTDGDAGQTRTYAITAGNTGGAFVINAATGEIRVNNSAAIDFETTPVFNLTVSVTDNGTPAATGTGVVTVTLLNVNDPPTILPQTFTVAENASAGVLVGNVIATEADPGQSITYAIIGGNTLNAFTINSSTGALTVNTPSALDFEVRPQFQLTVRVTDNGLPAQVRTAVITVNLTNVNEAPKFVVNNPTFTLPENSPAGTVAGQNGAIDPDGQPLTYTIISGNTNNAFSVDSQGRIVVNNPAALDFETGPNSFNLTVRATDPGNLSATSAMLVTVTNANDAPVVAPKAFSINENSANGAFIGTVTATDQDPGQTRTFSITGGNVNGAFAISATGVLSVANRAALNFETNPTFNLIVTATDNGNPARAGSATVTVFLRDVNEAPVVPAQQMAVATRSPVNTVVGTVQATDPDAGQTKTFAIVSGNGVFNNVFKINPPTGVITVNYALSVSFNTQYNLGVRVTDSANPALSTTGNVQIFVNSTGTVPRTSTPTASRTAVTESGIVAQQAFAVSDDAPATTVAEPAAKPKSVPFLSWFKKK
ncbi:MAG TPA: cadherin repeat domain-containing protein [Planctomycetaceae bacterium]|nr:cadherin repeat domain-containing protein [Planctomycetaceae bacterium]